MNSSGQCITQEAEIITWKPPRAMAMQPDWRHEEGPGEAVVFPLASGEVPVHSWETGRRGGGWFRVMLHLATGRSPKGAGAGEA
uniref:Uncharacterized protein n=1 Tax=Knipowitschia caucasica TaxID=637954 RepID=A0AAV2LN95_KNICA